MDELIRRLRKKLLDAEHLQYVIWHSLFEEGYFVEMLTRGVDALDANALTLKDEFHPENEEI
jgi:hypothetical protein